MAPSVYLHDTTEAVAYLEGRTDQRKVDCSRNPTGDAHGPHETKDTRPMAENPSKRSKEERRRYSQRRAQRTAASADKQGTRWTIGDARTALDLSLTVTEAAATVGRTAVAVELLRAKWRRGELATAIAAQVPPPPKDTPKQSKSPRT